MNLRFERPGRWSLGFYGVGLTLVLVAMALVWFAPGRLPAVRVQQLLIAGAILVSVGSVINVGQQLRRFLRRESKNTR